MASNITRWRLRSGEDRRFRTGHPWVYSNELQDSPKGIEPGAPIELCDPGGQVIARGYGNPASLIAFRTLTRNPEIIDPWSDAHILSTLQSAAKIRRVAGLGRVSHRLCFGEADRLPGLIIDRYRVTDAQVFVAQAHTAGMDRYVSQLPKILEQLVASEKDVAWNKTAIVIRNDLGVRKFEGLQEEEPRIVKEVSGLSLDGARIATIHGEFSCDLGGAGQKTGFFLDQAANVELAARRFKELGSKKIRILDLCCYVGQWSAGLGQVLKAAGAQVEVVAVDGSARALEHARENLKARGIACEAIKGDVLKDLDQLKEQSFDIVVSDPPALIKGRKDIPTGTHAYLQLNTQVFRLVKRGGAVVSCSCSGLLEEDKFLSTLSKAAYRNKVGVRWIARGTPSPDHPMLAEFPEGRYLKAWMGITE